MGYHSREVRKQFDGARCDAHHRAQARQRLSVSLAPDRDQAIFALAVTASLLGAQRSGSLLTSRASVACSVFDAVELDCVLQEISATL
jgi:hypothetical protein